MKIVVASMIHETCSFNNVQTTMEDFRENYFRVGPDVVNVPPKEWIIGSFCEAMRRRNFQVEGIVAANAFAIIHVAKSTARIAKIGRADIPYIKPRK